MAEMTAAEVAAWFEKQGKKIPADVQKQVEEEKTDATDTYLYERLSSVKDEANRVQRATQNRIFFGEVANTMLEFDGQEKNRPGRGTAKVFERHVGIETAHGFLKITLQQPVK